MKPALICLAIAVAIGAIPTSRANAGPAPRQIDSQKIESIIDASGLSGDVWITDIEHTKANSDAAFAHIGLLPEPYRGGYDGVTWRWASVTKQVVAVLVMQEVAAGRIDLDLPFAHYLPGFRGPNGSTATVRQLLQHRAGLPNPDDTAAKGDDLPDYYKPGYRGSRDAALGYCAGPAKGKPGGEWSYNNCDYIVAGALLKAVTGKTWKQLVQERIARPLKLDTLRAYPGERWTRRGRINGAFEPSIDLASFDAAAGLYGSGDDLMAFDVALMTGKLLPQPMLDILWNGDPALGYMALGQWVFEVPLKGCVEPVKIVERRGAVGGVEVRNLIVPKAGMAVAVFSDRAPFDFGEIWQGKGFSYDLLSAAVCS